jgi:hypothetical protein
LWAAAGADASNDKSDKSVEVMRKFSEQYARRSNTFFCADKTVTAVVIKVSAVSLTLVLVGDTATQHQRHPPINTDLWCIGIPAQGFWDVKLGENRKQRPVIAI